MMTLSSSHSFSAEDAKKNIDILSKELVQMDYTKLSSNEIFQFVFGLSHNNICDNLEIFTRFEPHILKVTTLLIQT
jgi:hypothetical protein